MWNIPRFTSSVDASVSPCIRLSVSPCSYESAAITQRDSDGVSADNRNSEYDNWRSVRRDNAGFTHEGWAEGPPPPPRPRMTWPLIVSFVNIANRGYANQLARIQTVRAAPLWIEELLQVSLPSEMIMEGRFECAYFRPSRRFLDLCKAAPCSILEASLEPNRQQAYCHLSPSKNFFFLMPHSNWEWSSSYFIWRSSHLRVGPPTFADHFLWAPQFLSLFTVPHWLCWNGSW